MGLGILRVFTNFAGVFEKALPPGHKAVGHRLIEASVGGMVSMTDILVEGDDMPLWEPGDKVAYVVMKMRLTLEEAPAAVISWEHLPDKSWAIEMTERGMVVHA